METTRWRSALYETEIVKLEDVARADREAETVGRMRMLRAREDERRAHSDEDSTGITNLIPSGQLDDADDAIEQMRLGILHQSNVSVQRWWKAVLPYLGKDDAEEAR